MLNHERKEYEKNLLFLLICIFALCGCSSTSNVDVVPKYDAVVYGSTQHSDCLIICNVEEGTLVDVQTYKLNDERTGWIDSFEVVNNELSSLDYISIRNNYSDNFKKTIIVRDGQSLSASEINNSPIIHNMAIYNSKYIAESQDEVYEKLKDINMYGEFVYFDNYEFSYDNEQIIGYQILSEKEIDNNFRNLLERLTHDDLSVLSQLDKYGYYELFMITLNFHKPVN